MADEDHRRRDAVNDAYSGAPNLWKMSDPVYKAYYENHANTLDASQSTPNHSSTASAGRGYDTSPTSDSGAMLIFLWYFIITPVLACFAGYTWGISGFFLALIGIYILSWVVAIAVSLFRSLFR